MDEFLAVFKRELLGYFRTPVAYVFIIIFLLASTGCTFFLGGFFDSNHAGLDLFFTFLPWLFLFLVPAVGMRLWAEDRRSGAIELLFSLPITTGEAVLAKFAAAWAFLTVALFLTFPLVITVNYLGAPDNRTILAGYLASFLMSGAYLAIASLTSALSRSQVVSFILASLICFLLVLISWGVLARELSLFLPVPVVDFIVGLGFVQHYETMTRGLVDARDILYFLAVIAFALMGNAMLLQRIRSR